MKKLLATLISGLFATVVFAQDNPSIIEQSKGAVAGTQKTQAAARGGPIPAEAIPTPPQPVDNGAAEQTQTDRATQREQRRQTKRQTIEQSKGAVAGTQKTQAAARGGPIPAEQIPVPPQPAAPAQPVAPASK